MRLFIEFIFFLKQQRSEVLINMEKYIYYIYFSHLFHILWKDEKNRDLNKK